MDGMKLGLMAGEGSGAPPDVPSILRRAQHIEAQGLDTAWVANVAIDGMSASAACGAVTERVEIGTAVVPSWPRHPFAMATETITVQSACDGRFSLGIGLSHRMLMEGYYGLSYDKPIRHMREYLEVLGPLLRGEPLDYQGELYSGVKSLFPPFAKPAPVLVAALGPQMLRLTGRLADGTITWATGPRTIEDHIGPELRGAAEKAGRPAPRIVAGFPIAVGGDAAKARDKAAEIFAMYRNIPSYRAMLDREGMEGVESLALVGDEAEIEKQLLRLRDLGVTDFCGFPFDPEGSDYEAGFERAAALLGELAGPVGRA